MSIYVFPASSNNASLKFKPVLQKHCEQLFDFQFLVDGGSKKLNNTVETKVTFAMSKTVFKAIKQFFKLKEHLRYKETFLDHSKLNYMARDTWIKVVEYFGGFAIKDEQKYDGFKFAEDELVRIDTEKPEISMKVSSDQSTHFGLGKLCYKQALMSFGDASKYIDGFTQCDQKYIIEVNRKKYQHLENSLAFLTKDDVLFENGETFVVFSFGGKFDFNITQNQSVMDIQNKIYPCRSKIIENLFMQESNGLYKALLESGKVINRDFKSMSYAEYRVGKDEADKRRKQAEDYLSRMKDNNDYTKKQIASTFRDIKMYGINEDTEPLDF